MYLGKNKINNKKNKDTKTNQHPAPQQTNKPNQLQNLHSPGFVPQ